jgi:hypothetical protein
MEKNINGATEIKMFLVIFRNERLDLLIGGKDGKSK